MGKTPRSQVTFGSEKIEITVERQSERTRARLIVRPDGTVVVRVPSETELEWVEAFVRRKAQWVFRHREFFESSRPRDFMRSFENGATVRYLGRQYRLRITHDGEAGVKLSGRHLEVCTIDASSQVVEGLVRAWYASRARTVLLRRAGDRADDASRHGLSKPEFVIRKMKRRWGSCSAAGRISLNPALVIAPIDCIDYVITHEICHTEHPQHNTCFYRLLSTLMPDWPRRRERLLLAEKYLPMG